MTVFSPTCVDNFDRSSIRDIIPPVSILSKSLNFDKNIQILLSVYVLVPNRYSFNYDLIML